MTVGRGNPPWLTFERSFSFEHDRVPSPEWRVRAVRVYRYPFSVVVTGRWGGYWWGSPGGNLRFAQFRRRTFYVSDSSCGGSCHEWISKPMRKRKAFKVARSRELPTGWSRVVFSRNTGRTVLQRRAVPGGVEDA